MGEYYRKKGFLQKLFYQRVLLICLTLLFRLEGLSQDVFPPISTEDSLTISFYKKRMARHINPNPDSALFYVLKVKELSKKINYPLGLQEGDYLHASYYRRLQKFDSATLYFQKALERALDIKYVKGIAISYNGLCRTYYTIGKMDRALQACHQCLTSANALQNPAVISDTYIALGNIYIRKNDLKRTLKYFLKVDSLHSVKPLRADIIAAAYQGLGGVYQQLKDYKKSEEYYLLANHEFEKMPVDPSFYLHTTNWHLGEIYYHQDRMKEADSLLTRSLQFFTRIDDVPTMAEISVYLGLIRLKENALKDAEKLLRRGFELHKKNKYTYEAAAAALQLAKVYNAKGAPEKAIGLLNNILAQEKENNSLIRQQAYFELAAAHYLKRKFKSAYNAVQNGLALKDSLNAVQNSAKIREIETLYQTQKKQQQIELLTAQNQLARKQKQQQLYILAGIIFVIFIVAVFFYVLYLNRRKTSKKLRELDRVKSNFFTNISHEFRTPLTLIKGPVEDQLSREDLDDGLRDNLQMVDLNADRLLSLVDQILYLSRLEAGSMELKLGPHPVSPFLQALVSSFQYAAAQKEICLTSIIPDVNSPVWFDPDIMEKVVLNLLSNAVKYTPTKGTIIFEMVLQGSRLKITVKNTGKGMKKEEVHKAFERFYQVNATHAGVGIGLALVKELVLLHKGTIEIASKEDEWTEFLVEIPVAGKAFTSAEIRTGAEKSSSVEKQPLVGNPGPETGSGATEDDKPSVLIVEDHADIRQLIRKLFTGTYAVMEAEDGVKGIDMAVAHVPDIIISDVMMPGKDGMELCQTLKSDERTSHIPIILLTAKAGDNNEMAGLETGADAYVVKPFNSELLKVRVQKLIASRIQLRQRYSQEVVLRPKDIALSSTDEKFLERVQALLDERLTEPDLTAENFSREVGMSRMQLHRKLKALTGLTTSEFIRSQRLQMAANLLKVSDVNISEIGYAVGFNDPSYFSKCFKDTYGCTPKEFEKNVSRV